jgi:predicted ATP-grasp superfamily ATP-dependent carboligase
MSEMGVSRGLLSRRVLVVGVSTRAAADSAARAGFQVTALDAFGDLDQHPLVRALSLRRDFGVPFSAPGAARVAARIECDAVAYLSNFENHPRAMSTLIAGRTLWGNPPAVLQRVRNPMRVMRALRRRGIATPSVLRGLATADPTSGQDRTGGAEPPRQDDRRRWLVKPLASGGGRHVRPWRLATPLPRGCYLQELVSGVPGSVVFVAASGRAVPLGLSRQLIGERVFGATGYRYCGSILMGAGDPQFARDEALVEAACALAQAVTREFNVVGVNGVDFVARNGVPHAIEINPRWSASMELVERAYGLSVFGAHAAACAMGALPDFALVPARRGAEAVGKAIVFAREDVAVGDTRRWLDDGSIRDVPHPGERILAGRPVCSVLTSACDAGACYAALVKRAERVYAELARWKRRIA